MLSVDDLFAMLEATLPVSAESELTSQERVTYGLLSVSEYRAILLDRKRMLDVLQLLAEGRTEQASLQVRCEDSCFTRFVERIVDFMDNEETFSDHACCSCQRSDWSGCPNCVDMCELESEVTRLQRMIEGLESDIAELSVLDASTSASTDFTVSESAPGYLVVLRSGDSVVRHGVAISMFDGAALLKRERI